MANRRIPAVTAVLYVLPASPPCATVELALELKGIPFRRVDLLPVAHVVLQRVRFGRRTVPGLVLDGGEKVIGSTVILRRLEALVPEPRLYPEGDAEVERAEEWGDQVLQPLMRRLVWGTLRRRPDAIGGYGEGADLPLSARLRALSAGTVARLEVRLYAAADQSVRSDLVNLDFHLDRIDRWIGSGTLGGPQANAADLQIASNLRILLTLGDLAPSFEGRPCAALARAQFPDWPGHVPAGVLPAEWLSGSAGAAR